MCAVQAVSALLITHVDWLGRITRRILERILGNSFPAQLNGRGKVVISVEHCMGSHLSLFDFFRFPKGPNDSAFSELVLCSAPNVGTQVVSSFLAVMNNDAVNICVQVFVWMYHFISLGFVSRNGIAGS